jgi:hypothetical protein
MVRDYAEFAKGGLGATNLLKCTNRLIDGIPVESLTGGLVHFVRSLGV